MTPRIVGLISFYDEPADCLSECIAALAEQGGIDKLVVVDGAYARYPDAKPASPVDQHAAVMVAARKHNLDLTFHVPAAPWAGDEVQKRTFLFRLGLSVTEPGDWFWVQDADQFVRAAPDLKQRLAETPHDVAALTLHDKVIENIPRDQRAPAMEEDFVLRCLFRAQPITVVRNHYTYVAADGSVLWGGQSRNDRMVPALEMPDVIVDHCPDRRPVERLHAKRVYYTDRDNSGAELGDCMVCVKPRRAVRKVPSELRLVVVGGAKVAAGTWIEMCGYHARKQEQVNARQLRSLGFDPEKGQFENRNGRINDFERVAA